MGGLMGIVSEACGFAYWAHAGQVRKYTGEPYITHCEAVANMVHNAGCHERTIAAAWLHDTVEDTAVTNDDILRLFGETVAKYVEYLTDYDHSYVNRATRKAADRTRLATAPNAVKTIKIADIIDNTKSIVEHDPAFAKVYLEEKRLLLPVLKGGDERLWAIAWEQCG